MPEFGFSLTHLLSYKDRLMDLALELINCGQGGPVFGYTLRNEIPGKKRRRC